VGSNYVTDFFLYFYSILLASGRYGSFWFFQKRAIFLLPNFWIFCCKEYFC